MRAFFERLLARLLRGALWFRYRIKVVGLDKLNDQTLNRPGGILFLSNHPTVLIDPIVSGLAVFPKYRVRPMIIDYMYQMPIIHAAAKFLRALPIPNFYVSSNSIKRKQGERVIQEIIQQLGKGEHFMIAPAGRVKKSPLEILGAASAVERILQEAKEVNIVLIRTKGLYGSAFSTYSTGVSPPIFKTLLWSIGQTLKNLLFFNPRREVIVELEPTPKDFPFSGGRLEINRYLENWYNRPDGLSNQDGQYPGDSLVLVSYSRWGNKFLPPYEAAASQESPIDILAIPQEIREKVIAKIAELANRSAESIQPEMNLANDLGLDSLDGAELSVFLQESFDLQGIPVSELSTVGKVMGLASKQITCKEEEVTASAVVGDWHKTVLKESLAIPEGKTIPEAFLRNCKIRNDQIACADEIAGVVTYSQLNLRVILLADYIRQLPGNHIGFLLPASVAANAIILAIQLAGKIPTPVNWTVGSRHLQSVLDLSDLKVVLTSMAFLDRLENVDLEVLEPYLVMLEDVRKKFTLKDKLKAFCLSKLSVKSILRAHGADKLTENDIGALLFTSGTESTPKGVPLTYRNLMSNLRGAVDVVQMQPQDVLFGILPPFHSFGFSVCGICALLCGLRVAYSPNPTDGKKLADGFEKWGCSLMVGPPTFVKGLIKSAAPGQLKTLRLCISGAEKAPPELFKMVRDLGGELLEGYGITECSPVLTMNPIVGKHKGVGVAFPHTEIAVVHPETFEELPVGTRGLILAKGEGIFSGYLNPGIASPFVDYKGSSWYKTGDLGVIDSDGYLTLEGRMKRFIKVGGEMVSLAAIEEALLESYLEKGWSVQEGPLLAVCAKEEAGEKTKLFLFTRIDVSVEAVNKLLKDIGFSNLVRFSSVSHLTEIPVGGTGKVNYQVLNGSIPK